MACYHPQVAYRAKSGRNPETGKWPIVFNKSQGYVDLPVVVPCGRCIGCRLGRARAWSVRAVHESVFHRHNCFITLTYRPEDLYKNCPGGSISPRPFQLFMKRLRKYTGEKIRFLHVSEYGSKLMRPHEHAILFGYDFPDRQFWRFSSGYPCYRSATLEKLWPFGFSEIGVFSLHAASYVARYVVKKASSSDEETRELFYKGLRPEQITHSNKPGLGRKWIEKYVDSSIFENGYIVINSKRYPIPRYYWDFLEKYDPARYERLHGFLRSDECDVVAALDVKELSRAEDAKALVLSRLPRNYEGQKLSNRYKDTGDIIMKMNLYSVYDKKADSYGNPFYMPTDATASRLFADQVLDASKPSLLNQHPEDFRLNRVGSFDTDTGLVVSLTQPEFIAEAMDFVVGKHGEENESQK